MMNNLPIYHKVTSPLLPVSFFTFRIHTDLVWYYLFKVFNIWNKFVAEIHPFPKQQILDSSKLKELADDNFKLDENGRKLSEKVENVVRKGEIAHDEQFLLFPQCFQKTCTADT